jgi:hypothetical protein
LSPLSPSESLCLRIYLEHRENQRHSTLTSLIQDPSDKDNLCMNTSIPGNSDSQPSFSWLRRLAIAGCLIVGCVFSFRTMMPDVAAKVTSETSAVAEIQASVDLSVPVDADVKLVTKNIEDIQAGDLVLARDEHGTAIGLKPVKETYQRVSHHLRHLTFEAPDGTQQSLSTTDEHPFWSVTAEEFVEAGELIVGHSVTGPNGETQTLVNSNREEFPEGVPVFNFQVTDYHTYFVAESADKPVMLVHNANCNELATAAASKFAGQNGTCTQCADAVKKAVGDAAEKVGVRARVGDFIAMDGVKDSITRNGFHEGVLVNGRIYDNFNSNGALPLDWLNSMHARGGLEILYP